MAFSLLDLKDKLREFLGQGGNVINQGIKNFNQPIQKTTPINWGQVANKYVPQPINNAIQQTFSKPENWFYPAYLAKSGGLPKQIQPIAKPIGQFGGGVVEGLTSGGLVRATPEPQGPIESVARGAGTLFGSLLPTSLPSKLYGATNVAGMSLGARLLPKVATGIASKVVPNLTAEALQTGLGYGSAKLTGNDFDPVTALALGVGGRGAFGFLGRNNAVTKAAVHPEDANLFSSAWTRLKTKTNQANKNYFFSGKNAEDEKLIRDLAAHYIDPKFAKTKNIKVVAQEMFNRINVDFGRPQMNALVGKDASLGVDSLKFNKPYKRGDVTQLENKLDDLLGTSGFVNSPKWKARYAARGTARDALEYEANLGNVEAQKHLAAVDTLQEQINIAREAKNMPAVKAPTPKGVGGGGVTPAQMRKDYPDSVNNPLYDEMRKAQDAMMAKIDTLKGKNYKTDAEIPAPIRKELDALKSIWDQKMKAWKDVYVNKQDIGAGMTPEQARAEFQKSWNESYGNRPATIESPSALQQRKIAGKPAIDQPLSTPLNQGAIADKQAMDKMFRSPGSPLSIGPEKTPSPLKTDLNTMVDNTAEASLKKASDLPTIDTTKGAQTQAQASTVLNNNGKGGFGGLEPTVQKEYQDWVNGQRARFTEGFLKSKDFQELDQQGLEGLFKVQSGENTPFTQKLRQYFDNKRAEVIAKTGQDIGYKENYLPQIWNNNPAEVEKVFGTSLNTKAPFSIESLIKDYKTGIEAGLTPRFNKVSDLVSHYEATANKVIADSKFFNFLAKEGLIQPQGKVGAGWATLDADRFPKIKVDLGKEGKYVGNYKAPDELAKLINNYLQAPHFQTLQKIADFASSSKNKMLSFGIPRTAINAHGFNILTRNILSSKNPLEGAVTGIKYMLAPSQAGKYLDQNLAKAPQAMHYGLTLSTSEYRSLLDEPKAVEGVMGGVKSLKAKFGERWNQTFEQGLFDKMIPALKLQKFYEVFDGYKKSGMKEYEAGKAAAKFTNEVFGGLNWQELGKSKDWQNAKRALILAPDWLGTNVALAKNLGKAFTTDIRNPAFQAYRRFGATFLGVYATMNAVNKLSSGHWMYQNDPGHAFEIEAGYTEDGQKRYIRPMQTSVDFIRLPVDVIIGLAKGDVSVPARIVRNRLSTIAGAGLGLVTDTNYAGQAVGTYGKDKYGREMTIPQRVAGIGGQLAGVVGFPAFGQQALNYATGQTGGEQALTQGFELPFRYSGGYFSGSDKEIADSLALKGKDRYDLGQTLKQQAPFSENQKLFIQQTGKEGLNQLIDVRKQKADLKQQKESNPLGAPPVSAAETSGSGKIVILTDSGDTKVIDLNKQFTEPKYTGNAVYDKKLSSKYTGSITSQQNDILLAAQKGKISEDVAIQKINDLEELKKKTTAKFKKPKKLPTIKIAAPRQTKIRLVAPNIKMLKIKPLKIKKSNKNTYRIKA